TAASSIRRSSRGAVLRAFLCDVLVRRAKAYDYQANISAELADLEEAQRLAEAAGDQPRLARALIDQIYPTGLMGRHPAALALGERALAMARELNDGLLEIEALVWLCAEQVQAGDLRSAKPTAQAVLKLARRLGSRWGEAWGLGRLGTRLAAEGDPQGGREML